MTFTLADAIVEVRADMTRVKDDVVKGADGAGKAGGKKLGEQLGASLNQRLKSLNLDEIDIKASPKAALAAIAATEERLRALSRDAATVEVRVKSEKALTDLARLRKQIGDVGEPAATGFAGRFGSKLSSLLPEELAKSLRGGMASPSALAAIGAGAVLFGPTIGGLVAGAVVGAVGIGGIVGGVALAAKDPVIVQQSKRIGDRFAASVKGSALAAFKVPILQALDEVDGAAEKTARKIGQIFASTAPSMSGLVKSLVRAGDALTGSLVVAADQSAAPLQALGLLIERVSTAVSDMIVSLADDADAGKLAFQDLADITVFLVDGFAGMVAILAKVREGLESMFQASEKAIYWLEDHSHHLDITIDGYKKGSKAAQLFRDGVIGAAGSVNDYDHYLAKAAETTRVYNLALSVQAVTADDVKKAQDRVKATQGALTESLAALGGSTATATQRSSALKTAMDNLYGATMRQADANQAYEASWDGLSDAIKGNSHSLNVHTAAGRTNRSALIALLGSTNDLYVADIAAGTSIANATKKHQNRIAAIKEESKRLGLNTGKTQDLINTYGKIPPKKTTDLILSGVNAIVKALKDLYIFQRAMADGIPIASEIAKLNAKAGPAKRFGGYASGGEVGGWSPHRKADNIPALLTAREWVHPVDTVDYYGPGVMKAIQNRRVPRGLLAGMYAAGGQVAPVDASTRIPFRVSLAGTHIMTKAEAASKVTPAIGSIGAWPSSPSAQRGDSGVWRKIVAFIQATGPVSGSFGNAYRAGDPLWHGSGRAVDWMGFNQDKLAHIFLRVQSKILEMIHRTNTRDYAYTRGRNMGSFNNALMEAHRNHLHIAMRAGGQVPQYSRRMARLAKVAMADSGNMTLERGWNLIGNGTGQREQMAAVGGGTTITLINHGVIGSKGEVDAWLTSAVIRLHRERKL